jgi:hypothetical protein
MTFQKFVAVRGRFLIVSCNDGFRFYVGGRGSRYETHYATHNNGAWITLEVRTNKHDPQDELLLAHAERNLLPEAGAYVYRYVPVPLIHLLIAKHGGEKT